MAWKQRNETCKTVSDAVCALSGLSESELLRPAYTPPQEIQNLSLAADAIREAVQRKENISVMGDYDADGVTASSILYFALEKLGTVPYVRLPKRMSEGYGLNPSIIPEFKPGLLITVDNGIAAHDAIEQAKANGLKVIVLDHHLPQGDLPSADIIVDPHVEPANNGFEHYCGAGLAYKLAELLFPCDSQFLTKMQTLATIGTIADSVPLVGDNRFLVQNGLVTMKKWRSSSTAEQSIPAGLIGLLQVADVYDIDETDIGYKIGPMINAAGRMRDDGAALAFRTLTADSIERGVLLATELQTLNEARKEETAKYEAVIEEVIERDCLAFTQPMCVFVENMPEGLVGILTGRIAEKYKTPAFLFTNSSEKGQLKGSGRSYGDFNLMNLVNAAMPFLVRGGGHAGAAGISVTEENYGAMVNAMTEQMQSYELPETDDVYYDLTVKSSDISHVYAELQKFAPFGQNVPRPVFQVNDILLSPRGGNTSKRMGKHFEHIKLFGRGFSIICFGMAEEYVKSGSPLSLDVIGMISQNAFRYSSETQIEAVAFKEHKTDRKGRPTSLRDALIRNGTI